MIDQALQRLNDLLIRVPPRLRACDEARFSAKPAPDKWSKKEIIGHLIDSATNNHHRFVRAQFEESPAIAYQQNAWNRCGHYQSMDKERVISFWEAYNTHLLELLKRIPAEMLQRTCDSGDAAPRTLDFLINDYVAHMEHHLKQVVED